MRKHHHRIESREKKRNKIGSNFTTKWHNYIIIDPQNIHFQGRTERILLTFESAEIYCNNLKNELNRVRQSRQISY